MHDVINKSLPSSDDAEKIVLASVLIDGTSAGHVAEMLESSDFYSVTHRRIFDAMVRLHANGKPPEAMLIAEDIKANGFQSSAAEVAAITIGMPFYAEIDEYIAVIRQKAAIRQLVKTCHAIAQTAMQGESDDTILTDAQEQITDICNQAGTSSREHFLPVKTVIQNDVLQALEDLRYGRSRKIKLGFEAIDFTLGGGIALSDVLLVAADTGNGKSSFALQLASNIAKQGVPVAFIAGEMTSKENVLRMLSQISGITNLNWLSHISDPEYVHLQEWAQVIAEMPIFFEHRISDMQSLRTHLQSRVKRDGVKVLVIDYIQLFKLERIDKRKRFERIAEASQETKRIANEFGIAVVEVAQFNREGAKSGKAGLHDLEGSGQLEKDASLIFLLDLEADETYVPGGENYRKATIRIEKGRNVGKGVIEGKFYGKSVRFEF